MSDPNERYRPPGPDDETRQHPVDPAPEETPVSTPSAWDAPRDEAHAWSPPAPDATPASPAEAQTWSPPAPDVPDAPPPWQQVGGADTRPVQPPPAAQQRSRGGPLRWIAALLVTILVVGAVGGVAYFASRSSTAPSPALTYLPATTFAYDEVRLDLPGDQHQKVGEFLAHFPGFADRSTLDQGMDQLLDRVLKSVSKDRYSYTGDVKPWFSGQVSVAILELPQIASLGLPQSGSTAMPQGRMVVILGVNDKAKAQAELEKIRGDITAAGGSFVGSDHNGTAISSISGPNGAASVSYALTSDALVLATQVDDLNAALDRKTANGENLGTSTAFKESLGRLRGDRVGMAYLNTDSIRTQLASLAPAGQPGSAILSYVLGKIPAAVMSSIRFDADRLVVESISKPPQGAPAGTGKSSDLAKHVPGDSLAYLEASDIGTAVRELVVAAKSDPAYAQMGPQVQQQIASFEGILGSKFENYLDWVDNIAITGGISDGQPALALLASVNDEAAANQHITQLVGFAQFGGAQAGIKIAQQDYAGTKLYVIDLGQITSFALGAAPSASPTSLAFAVKDKVFYLGYGEAYVKKLLDLKPEASLGQAERFSAALKAAGGPATSGLVYVDITAIRTTLESFLKGEQKDKYEKEYKPYLLPLDQLISVGAQDGTDQRMQFQLIVK